MFRFKCAALSSYPDKTKRLLDANQVSNVCTKHFSQSLKVWQVIGQTFPQPRLGLTFDGARLSGGVKYYYNICFCFYKVAKLYKASTLFLFFVSGQCTVRSCHEISPERQRPARASSREIFCKITPCWSPDTADRRKSNIRFIKFSSNIRSHDERIPCHLVFADRFENMTPVRESIFFDFRF